MIPIQARKPETKTMASYPLSPIVRQWSPSAARGFKLERQGDHESAMVTLGTVEKQIDNWLENLEELETEVVDKRELMQDLEEAKESISLDSWEQE